MSLLRHPATVTMAHDDYQPSTEDPPAEDIGAGESANTAALTTPIADETPATDEETPTTSKTPTAADEPAPLTEPTADETPTGDKTPTATEETPTTSETPTAADEPAPLAEPTADEAPAIDEARRWHDLVVSFVDGPRDAVDAAHELVSSELDRVVRALEAERARLRAGSSSDASTEDLRVTLVGLRALLQRLHALPS